MKQKFRFYPKERIFKFGEKFFTQKKEKFKKIDGVEHLDYIEFEEIDKKEHDRLQKELGNILTDKVSKKDVVAEIIKRLPIPEVRRILKICKDKKPKITKQKGCLGINIDGGKYNKAYVELFD